MPWYDTLVSVITLMLNTVGVESSEMVSMDTTLVHLVVSGGMCHHVKWTYLDHLPLVGRTTTYNGTVL